jgi:hypothetical protein
MDEADFRALIAAVEAHFVDIGASELAEEDHYVSRNIDSGEEQLLEPKERLIGMLKALDRYVAVRDGTTLRDAMQRIRENTRDGAPERVVFVPIADAVERDAQDFSDLPDLSQVRSALRLLIERLGVEPLDPTVGAF